jgi:DNA-binding NarL/FixJ family response regulator
LKPRFPDILFMMCTVYEEDEKIFEALAAGANGYILKKTAPAKLLESIRELAEGGAPMSSQIARKVVAAFQEKNTLSTGLLDTLSNREHEILELLAKGLLYKEISTKLGIAQETVRKHVYHIYEKLHVNNRVEAVNKYFGR